MNLSLKKINLEFNKEKHVYSINGTWVPGCTSITGVLPKDWLANWAAKETVSCLKGYWKPNQKYSQKEIDDLLYLGKTAHTRKKESAADKGTLAHAWFEQFVKIGIEPLMPEEKEVANAVERFKEWKNQHQIEWLASELMLGSEKYMFAGTLDALAIIDGKTCLVDFKTSSGIFPEHYIQTAGYQICLEELNGSKIEERWILRFPKIGTEFEAKKVPTSFEDDKKVFLSALEIYRWLKKVENKK